MLRPWSHSTHLRRLQGPPPPKMAGELEVNEFSEKMVLGFIIPRIRPANSWEKKTVGMWWWPPWNSHASIQVEIPRCLAPQFTKVRNLSSPWVSWEFLEFQLNQWLGGYMLVDLVRNPVYQQDYCLRCETCQTMLKIMWSLGIMIIIQYNTSRMKCILLQKQNEMSTLT